MRGKSVGRGSEGDRGGGRRGSRCCGCCSPFCLVLLGVVVAVLGWAVTPHEEASYAPNGKRIFSKELLGKPALPPLLQFINWMQREKVILVEPEKLMLEAKQKTGLSKFWGDEKYWRSGLEALAHSVNKEAKYVTPVGREAAKGHVLNALTIQLRLRDLIERFPEIENEEIGAPIIIAGLPRTGSTHMHRLLGEALPQTRFLPFYDTFDPIASEALAKEEIGTSKDSRVWITKIFLGLVHWARPSLGLMQVLDAEQAFEEVGLLSYAFGAELYEVMWQHTDTYSEWYRSTDHAPAYSFLKSCLKLVQWQRGGARLRWVLKTPQNAEHLGAIMRVFPDAKIVATHREVLPVITSVCALTSYCYGTHADRVDVLEVGNHWYNRFNWTLQRLTSELDRLSPQQLKNVYFSDFMKDQKGTVKDIAEWAGLGWGAESETAVQAHLDANPRGGSKAVQYSLDVFGVSAEAVQKRFAWYNNYISKFSRTA
eukprot:Hpha_TRINITY_DN4009_c0_g2::TRINITY_DN4009_c0_g2_i1::g.63804::m.63804